MFFWLEVTVSMCVRDTAQNKIPPKHAQGLQQQLVLYTIVAVSLEIAKIVASMVRKVSFFSTI
jgi:hypothetical protein